MSRGIRTWCRIVHHFSTHGRSSSFVIWIPAGRAPTLTLANADIAVTVRPPGAAAGGARLVSRNVVEILLALWT